MPVVQKVRHGIRASLSSPFAVSNVVGLALFYAWNLLEIYLEPYFGFGDGLGGSGSSPGLVVLTSGCSVLGYLAVALAFARWRRREAIAFVTALVIGVCGIISWCALSMGLAWAHGFFYVYRAVSRLLVACTAVGWGIRYCTLTPPQITVQSFASLLLASAICLASSVLNGTARSVVAPLLIPLSAFALLASARRGACPQVDGPRSGADDGAHPLAAPATDDACRTAAAGGAGAFARSVWRIVVVFYTFGIVTWIVMLETGFGTDNSMLPLVSLACMLVALVPLLGALAVSGSISYQFAYKIVVPIMLFGLLAIATFGADLSFGPMLIFAGYTCFDLFLLVIVCNACRDAGVRPSLAIGVCRAIESSVPLAVLVLPGLAGGGLPSLDGDMLKYVFGITGLVILLVSLLSDGKRIVVPEGDQADADGQEAQASPLGVEMRDFARQFDLAVERYQIAPREAQVMSLVVRGRTVPYIAECLSLSRSTVKTYIARIYQKMGVKGRQEMLDVIEAVELAPEAPGPAAP